jgi:SAM-dependent methyltransferase
VPTDNAAAWDRLSAGYQVGARLPTDVAHYGPDIPTEADLRLVGDVRGRRVLELGCGGAQCSIAFAKAGATAIGVDFSAEQLAFARRLAEREGVRIELRQGDLADLAFLRAESVDVVFSAYAFGFVEDLRRVFRQVHRVLRRGGPLVFSLPHPAYDMIDDDSEEPLLVRRSYFDRSPIDYVWDGVPFTDYHHTIGDLFTDLVRTGYVVDTLLEPEPRADGPRSPHWREAFRFVPRTLIVRAFKESR